MSAGRNSGSLEAAHAALEEAMARLRAQEEYHKRVVEAAEATTRESVLAEQQVAAFPVLELVENREEAVARYDRLKNAVAGRKARAELATRAIQESSKLLDQVREEWRRASDALVVADAADALVVRVLLTQLFDFFIANAAEAWQQITMLTDDVASVMAGIVLRERIDGITDGVGAATAVRQVLRLGLASDGPPGEFHQAVMVSMERLGLPLPARVGSVPGEADVPTAVAMASLERFDRLFKRPSVAQAAFIPPRLSDVLELEEEVRHE